MPTTRARLLVLVAVLLGSFALTSAPAQADDAAPDNQAFVLSTFPRLWWGCEPVGIRVENPPTPAHRDLVVASLARLNRLAGWAWYLTDDPAARFVIRWDSTLDLGSGYFSGGASATNWTGAVITLSPRDDLTSERHDGQRYSSASAALEHELGHAIGLGHTNYPGSLMGRAGGDHYGVPDMFGIRYVALAYARRCAS